MCGCFVTGRTVLCEVVMCRNLLCCYVTERTVLCAVVMRQNVLCYVRLLYDGTYCVMCGCYVIGRTVLCEVDM